MALTSNRAVLAWIDEMAAMTQPDQLVWIDGSEAQLEELRKQACASGEIEKLNEEKLPGCYLHRTAVNDVARVEDRTFICCKKQEDAGPTNHWMDPQEMYAKLKKLYTGAMKGRTMYVIPYSMGVVGSPFAKYGIELTDSIYVVLNMAIMTRVGRAVADVMGDDFVKGLHAKADIDPENRYIVHFPEDNTIMSVNSGYGGNVLLGKKCFALRIASTWAASRAGWRSTCSFWAWRTPRGRCATWPPPSPPPAARPTWPCSSPRSTTRRRAGRSGVWGTTSPGCASARTAGCGP